MNSSIKKIELIEWLSRLEDDLTLQKIEMLRKDWVRRNHESRIPETIEDLQEKLKQI